MQEIDLRLIQDSPNPVRKSWDEDKMNELAASIAEQGVIVPVKVRPLGWYCSCLDDGPLIPMSNERCLTCGNARVGHLSVEDLRDGFTEWEDSCFEFELVYGHRRTEAARRANLESIPAIVEGVDDTDALIQALIENVQREDMEPMDTARALRALMDSTGWSQRELKRQGIIDNTRAQQLLGLLSAPAEVQRLTTRSSGGEVPVGYVTEMHVRETMRAANGDDAVVTPSIRKAASEGLTAKQTRAVAESVAAAPSEEARDQLLREPYSPNLHDPEMIRDRANRYGANDAMWTKPATIDRVSVTDSPEARAILDLVKRWRDQMRAAQQSINAGKLSPEACRFLASRVSKFASELAAWSDELEVTE